MYNAVEEQHEASRTLNSIDCSPAFRLNEAYIDLQLFMLGLVAVAFLVMVPIEVCQIERQPKES
eukprot:7893542-Prorocentrum_lima.AAC.1